MRGSVLLLLALTVLSACSTFTDPQRDDNQYACEPGEPTDPRVDFELKSPALMDVHLTAQGALVDRCQWTAALYQLNNWKVKDDRDKIIVMHIHGWKHNGDPDDSERARFRQVLEGIEESQRISNNNTQVVGIFVAWPGLTLDIAGLRNLTFFSRTAVADRVSQSAIVGKLIGTIESITDKRKAQGKNDVFIMMGYSLGARILFNATAQVALYETQLAFPDEGSNTYDVIDGPGDLVMLLNPAISAGNYTALDSIRRSTVNFSPKQNPIFLTISTENDTVTKYAFPTGHIFRLDWDRERRTAIGEYPAYITHHLARSSEDDPENQSAPDRNDAAWFDDFCADSICLKQLPFVAEIEPDVEGELKEIKPPSVLRVQQSANPFIVAKTTSEIIDGHGGFWASDVFSNWLGAFVQRTLEAAKADNQ